jgi:hypothetical protein
MLLNWASFRSKSRTQTLRVGCPTTGDSCQSAKGLAGPTLALRCDPEIVGINRKELYAPNNPVTFTRNLCL